MLRSIAQKLSLRKSLRTVQVLRCLSDEIIDFPNMGPPIPEYPEKSGETLEIKRARLLYQSRKRGMSENGLLLSNFAGKYLRGFDKKQLNEFDKLINKPSNDWDLYYWILGKEYTPVEYNSSVMDLLKEYCKNKDMEERHQQPNLPE